MVYLCRDERDSDSIDDTTGRNCSGGRVRVLPEEGDFCLDAEADAWVCVGSDGGGLGMEPADSEHYNRKRLACNGGASLRVRISAADRLHNSTYTFLRRCRRS